MRQWVRKHLINGRVPKENEQTVISSPSSFLSLLYCLLPEKTSSVVPPHSFIRVLLCPEQGSESESLLLQSGPYQLIAGVWPWIRHLTSPSIFKELRTTRPTSEVFVLRLERESMCVHPEEHLVEVRSANYFSGQPSSSSWILRCKSTMRWPQWGVGLACS